MPEGGCPDWFVRDKPNNEKYIKFWEQMMTKRINLISGPKSHLFELHGDRYDGDTYTNGYVPEFKKCLNVEHSGECKMLLKPNALRFSLIDCNLTRIIFN